MTAFGAIMSFGLSLLLFQCKGQIISPPGRDELTLSLGSNATIAWSTHNPDNIVARSWTFIGKKKRGLIASSGVKGAGLLYFSSGLDVKIQGLDTLVVINVNRSYDGIYRFGITDSVTGSYTSDVRVIIAVTPSLSINCSHVNTVNTSVNFSCVCEGKDGNPPANVTWYKGKKIFATGIENATLELNYVTNIDSGNYTCEAKSYEKATNKTEIELIVNYPPEGTSLKISYVGTSVTITCDADALPLPTYKILRNGTVIATGKTYFIRHQGTNSSGNYTCVAENFLGERFSLTHFLPIKRITPSTTQQTQSSTIQPSTAQPLVPSTTSKVVVPDDDDDDDDEDKTDIGLIVGVVVGVVALIVIVFCAILYFKSKARDNKRGHADVNPNGSRVMTNHYELDEDHGEDAGAYDSVKQSDNGEGSQDRKKPAGDSLPPVYASVNKDNRQGNTLYASLDSEALRKPGSKKKQPETKNAPTEYASIDFMQTGKTPNADNA